MGMKKEEDIKRAKAFKEGEADLETIASDIINGIYEDLGSVVHNMGADMGYNITERSDTVVVDKFQDSQVYKKVASIFPGSNLFMQVNNNYTNNIKVDAEDNNLTDNKSTRPMPIDKIHEALANAASGILSLVIARLLFQWFKEKTTIALAEVIISLPEAMNYGFSGDAFWIRSGGIWECAVDRDSNAGMLLCTVNEILRKLATKIGDSAGNRAMSDYVINMQQLASASRTPSDVRKVLSYKLKKGGLKKLDCNWSKLPFSNGVFNLSTGSFGEYTDEDFYSMHTGYPYAADADNFPPMDKFLEDIMPVHEKIKYLLYLLSTLLDYKTPNDKVFFIGSGFNGKSMLVNLLKYALRAAASSISSSFFTRCKVSAGQASPEILCLKNVKTAILQEPLEENFCLHTLNG